MKWLQLGIADEINQKDNSISKKVTENILKPVGDRVALTTDVERGRWTEIKLFYAEW